MMNTRVLNLDFLYFDAGGGHRAAATALKLVIEQQGRPWRIRLVNLEQILRPADIFYRLSGHGLQDVYNLLLKRGWTLGTPELLPLMHLLIRFYHRSAVRLIEQFWRDSPPDIVVSLIPHFNRATWQALRNVNSATPYVTILTDFADYPSHFWIERQPQFFICGTEEAAAQARVLGHPAEAVFQVSGMIIHPRFYEPAAADGAAERRRIGLDPGLPTGLVLFGGQGSSMMVKIAGRLESAGVPLQLILICGRNEKLRRALSERKFRIPVFVEGFTNEVPYYMRLSDFFIGKPGPGSISEALAMKLPVIVQRNHWTMPQERFNADWVRRNQLGEVFSGVRRIGAAVRSLLDPARFESLRTRAAAVRNRAVFEIPDILERILARSR